MITIYDIQDWLQINFWALWLFIVLYIGLGVLAFIVFTDKKKG